jgi:hypothetical protein
MVLIDASGTPPFDFAPTVVGTVLRMTFWLSKKKIDP